MARSLGSREARQSASFDGRIAWQAKLLQPISRLTPGSIEPIVVEIIGPVELNTQEVFILFDDVWWSAQWVGEPVDPGEPRQAMTVIEATSGTVSRVRVRVHAGPQQPLMDVGRVRVKRG